MYTEITLYCFFCEKIPCGKMWYLYLYVFLMLTCCPPAVNSIHNSSSFYIREKIYISTSSLLLCESTLMIINRSTSLPLSFIFLEFYRLFLSARVPECVSQCARHSNSALFPLWTRYRPVVLWRWISLESPWVSEQFFLNKRTRDIIFRISFGSLFPSIVEIQIRVKRLRRRSS